MPIINRFDRPRKAWPPPAGPEEVGDAVDYTRRRDPIGDGVQTALAVLAAFGMTISTAVASVSISMLIGYSLLRLPNAWRGWMPLARSLAVTAWFAWFAWAAISGLWTPNLLDWGDSLGGFLAIMLFPAFFLVTRSWRWILGAFVAGSACQGVAQVIHASVPAWRPEWQPRFDGLATHPGHVATVSSMALLVALGWLFEAKSRRARVALVLVATACVTSIALGAGRGAMVGVTIGGATLVISLGIRYGLGFRGWALSAAAPAVAAIGLGLAFLGFGPESLVHMARDTRTSAPDSSISQRILWWQAASDAFRDHPIAGLGTGGTATWFDASPRINEHAAGVPGRPRSFFSSPHPHSVYYLTLSEQGLIGMLLLLVTLGSAVRSAWQTTAVRPVGCGLLAAIVTWWVAGSFESINLPMRLVAPLILASSLACLPRGPGVGLGPLIAR